MLAGKQTLCRLPLGASRCAMMSVGSVGAVKAVLTKVVRAALMRASHGRNVSIATIKYTSTSIWRKIAQSRRGRKEGARTNLEKASSRSCYVRVRPSEFLSDIACRFKFMVVITQGPRLLQCTPVSSGSCLQAMVVGSCCQPCLVWSPIDLTVR